MFVDGLGTLKNKQFKHKILPQIIYLLHALARNGNPDHLCTCSSPLKKINELVTGYKDNFLTGYDAYPIFIWDQIIPPLICTNVICTFP